MGWRGTPDDVRAYGKNLIGTVPGRGGFRAGERRGALRLVGYDYVISIEHEDALMAQAEGLAKGVALLREAVIAEPPGEMFWA